MREAQAVSLILNVEMAFHMVNDQDSKQIPPTAIIIDTISNLVGAYVNGLSKRTQYYSFIDTAKGNSLQQPYLAWFARQILEPLEKAEKGAIQRCFETRKQADTNLANKLPIGNSSDRLYRGILIDDEDKIALAESRFSRCKGWFEETHRDTEIFPRLLHPRPHSPKTNHPSGKAGGDSQGDTANPPRI